MADESEKAVPQVRSFWAWLTQKDRDGDRGIFNLIDLSNLAGILISFLAALVANADASKLALGIALPVTAALVGISFAWAGRSASLLQDQEYSLFIIEYGAPPEGYVYSFQLAILSAVFAVLVAAIISSETFLFSTGNELCDEILNRFFLFSAAWIAGRECWGVIDFSNKLAIQFYEVRKAKADI